VADAEIELRLNELEARWRGDPSSRLFLQLAEAMRRSGRLRDAIRVLEEGLRSHPEAISGLVALGRCQLDNGEPIKAVASLEKAIERDPSQFVANKLLVEALIQTGEPDRAEQRLEIYRLINDRDDDIGALRERIEALHGASATRREPLGGTDGEPAPRPDVAGPMEATPRDGTAALEPFGTLFAAPSAGARILRFLAREGIFAAAPAAAGRRPAAAEVESAAAVEVAPPETELRAMTESAGDETRATFSMRYIGEEVERESGDETIAIPSLPTPDSTVAVRPGYSGREADEDAILEPHGSATLAALYLRQGHLDEAAQQYEAVLRAKPGDATAMAGLAEIQRRRAPAAQSTEEAPRTLGLTQRKVRLLKHFLSRIRGQRAKANHVS